MAKQNQSKLTVRDAARRARAFQALRDLFATYPWLWGVTKRWFFGEDQVEVRTLTAPILKQLAFSKITDVGGSSWFVYQRIRSDIEQVEDVGTYSTSQGAPMARVVRNYSGVAFLGELKWVYSGTQGHRQITLYKVPQGPHGGSSLNSLCVKALEIGGDGLDDKKSAKARVKAVMEVSRVSGQPFNPKEIIETYLATSDKRMKRLADAASLISKRTN